jgi:uncharacterized protein (DUF2336 family)
MLAERLAPVPNAPRRLMHKLAADYIIAVAAVLSNSSQLDDPSLA